MADLVVSLNCRLSGHVWWRIQWSGLVADFISGRAVADLVAVVAMFFVGAQIADLAG